MSKNKDRVIHMIGNSHLDPVWLWQWQEGYSEIKATFQSALDRMNEYDDFIFVCGAIGQFKWVEENCIEMFEEIKQRVKEGRFVIVGGWWVQPDCNLPCGESFVRHSLYSQLYLLEKFNKIATTGYNVDSFGHNYMIPQILKKSGMDNYIFMRPGATEKDIPDPLFMWESPDGSQVLTFRILDNHYNNSFRKLEEVTKDAFNKKDLNTEDIMLFYGVGNHGGGPTIKAIEIVHKLQEEMGSDRLIMSSPDKYFNDIKSKIKDFKVLKEDLQYHASGCYATHFEFKKNHRKTEQLLLATERWNTISNISMGYTDESERIKSAWEQVLFNQFHDIMGGCSIEAALNDAEKAIAFSEHIADDVINASIQKISWAIDTSLPGAMRSKEESGRVWSYKDHPVPLVVFNPLPFPISVPIKLDILVEKITDSDKNFIETQNIVSRYLILNRNKATMFIAEIPALGYNTYWLTPPKKPKIRPVYKADELLEQRYVLENQYKRLELDKKTGLIISLIDKETNIEFIKTTAGKPLIIEEEKCDTWAHGYDTFDDVIGEFKTQSVSLIEDGPLRSIIRVSSSYNNSKLRQDYILYKDSKDIKVSLRVNWQEEHKMLKLAFDIDVSDPIATYSCPYGFISKECDNKEEPGQMWMDLSDKESNQGLSLACDSRYSYSAKGSSMRLNVVRSPLFADHDSIVARSEDNEFMDIGIHKMNYMLITHSKDFRSSNVVQKALILNNPPLRIHETYHEGTLPLKKDNVSISSNQVILTVLKPSEDKNSEKTVIRLYESFGKEIEVDLVIPILNLDTKLTFKAFEIKSLLVDKNGSAKEINLIEQIIEK